MNTTQRIQKWAAELSTEQSIKLIVDLVADGINSEDISFPDNAISPYCSHTGDTLVDGQKAYSEDD